MKRRFLAYPLAVTLATGLTALAGMGAAVAVWLSASPAVIVHAGATTMPAGNRPGATASAAAVTVSWAASDVAGRPVAGYRVTRYGSTGPGQAAGNGCAGVVSATSCVESAVPDGTWGYTVTPVQGAHWAGPEGPQGTVEVSTVGITFPVAGRVYGIDGYDSGCGGGTGDMCGTATGPKPVTVSVSVRRDGGDYWNPGDNTFSSTGERLFPLGKGASWKLPFPVSTFPASGRYTLRAVATDNAGRVSTTSSTFTVYPQAPPVPAFTGTPADPTNQTSATFRFTSGQSTVECSLDNAAFAACQSPVTVGSLTNGGHRFRVRAVDPGGNASASAIHTWTVDAVPPRATDVQASNGGGTAGQIGSGDSLTLSYSERLAPGSVLAGWDGRATAVTVAFTAATQTVSVNGTALGAVNLGRPGYVLHDAVASGTLSMNGSDVVVDIGAVDDPGAFGTVTGAGTMTWRPGAGTDPAGNSLGNAGTDIAERHPGELADIEF